eukprot:6005389-Prymnesium_polylepis.1
MARPCPSGPGGTPMGRRKVRAQLPVSMFSMEQNIPRSTLTVQKLKMSPPCTMQATMGSHSHHPLYTVSSGKPSATMVSEPTTSPRRARKAMIGLQMQMPSQHSTALTSPLAQTHEVGPMNHVFATAFQSYCHIGARVAFAVKMPGTFSGLRVDRCVFELCPTASVM